MASQNLQRHEILLIFYRASHVTLITTTNWKYIYWLEWLHILMYMHITILGIKCCIIFPVEGTGNDNCCSLFHADRAVRYSLLCYVFRLFLWLMFMWLIKYRMYFIKLFWLNDYNSRVYKGSVNLWPMRIPQVAINTLQ